MNVRSTPSPKRIKRKDPNSIDQKPQVDLIIIHANELVTMDTTHGVPRVGLEMKDLAIISDGAVAISRGSIIFIGTTKELYSNLIQNTTDYSNSQTLMRLKDPDLEPGNNNYLLESEREFIRYFNNHIFYSLKYMAPDVFTNITDETQQRELVKALIATTIGTEEYYDALQAVQDAGFLDEGQLAFQPLQLSPVVPGPSGPIGADG